MTTTFYQQQVAKINIKLYGKHYLTRHIIRAKHHIDHNFSTAITLDAVAAEAYISKFHFARLFKQYYGVTPNQYLTSVRIGNAKKLLVSGSTISAACFAAGYHSVSTFSALFQKQTGLSPGAFQQKSKKQY